jgi:Ni,Fe-hydrogenase I cytochrome b subunit
MRAVAFCTWWDFLNFWAVASSSLALNVPSYQPDQASGTFLMPVTKYFLSFFFKIIYFMYVSTLLLSSDTQEEGIGSPLYMAVSHHVVAGN